MGVQINGSEGNVIATKGTYSGNVTIGGTLTYEDVTNIDSVGLITARTGIEIGTRPGVAASISVDGNMIVSGIATIGSKLGIGGITPTAKLQVTGGGAYTVANSGRSVEGIDIDSSSGDVNGAFGGAISFGVGDVGRSAIAAVQNSDDTDNTGLAFFTHPSNTGTADAVERLRITSNGSIGINSTSPAATLDIHDVGSTGPCLLLRGGSSTEGDTVVPDGENFNFGHWNYSSSTFTERLRITSAGRTLIQEGTFSERTLGVSAKLQIEGTDAPTSTISVTRNSNDTNPSYIHFGKSRGTATGANTILQTGDSIGALFFYGADGNDIYSESAFIRVGIATGRTQASTTVGSNSTPGVIEFATTLDGDASARKHVEIDSDGIFKMMTGNTENDNNSGFDTNQNPIGFYKIKVNDETNSADILMPKPGCLVIIQPYSTYPAYPQPKASIAYVDSGASKRADVFLDPFTQLAVKTSLETNVSNCDNDKYTVMPGNAFQTLRITNRIDTEAYTFCITMI